MEDAVDKDDGEYSVVEIHLNPAILSIALAAVPFIVGLILDELPGLPYGLYYYRHVVNTAIGAGIAGAVFGLVAARNPKRRRLGLFGFFLNAMILSLFGLFMYLFRIILTR